MKITLVRFNKFGLSILEVSTVNSHRSMVCVSYNPWDPWGRLDFSILWLKKHGLALSQGLRILVFHYECMEECFWKRFALRLIQ